MNNSHGSTHLRPCSLGPSPFWRWLSILSAACAFCVAAWSQSAPIISKPVTTGVQTAGLSFEIFALDNGVGRRVWPADRQASTLREIGFDGMACTYTNPGDLKSWLTELAKRRLKLYGIYFLLRLQSEKLLPTGIEEAIPLLRGTGAVLWLAIPKPARTGDFGSEALKGLQETADLAATARLRVVLYPHAGFHIATAEDAYALASRSGRANVGVTVNLAHELAAGNGGRLPEIIRRVAPCLAMATINGASTHGTGWDNHIKLLGTGDYDVAAVLQTLYEVNYYGPVGIQFFGIKGDPRENLSTTMRAWWTLARGGDSP